MAPVGFRAGAGCPRLQIGRGHRGSRLVQAGFFAPAIIPLGGGPKLVGLQKGPALKAQQKGEAFVQPQELGPPPKGADPYVRNNLWQLYTALTYGPEKVRFVALWDGQAGDGPGGTKDMIEAIERHGGNAYVLRTTDLW